MSNSPKVGVAIRIFHSSGTLYVTDYPGGMNIGNDYYEERLLPEASDVERATRTPPDKFSTTQVRLTFADHDRKFSKLADGTFYGTIMRIDIGRLDVGSYSSSWRGIFDGCIIEHSAGPGEFSITCDEKIWPLLMQPIEGAITAAEYPNLPRPVADMPQPFKNRIYGNATRLTETTGAVLFPQIDTRRVHVAAHVCRGVDQVYDLSPPGDLVPAAGIGGLLTVGTHYTVTTVVSALTGRTETVIDTTYDIAGSSGLVGNVRGVTDDGTATGTLVEEPTDVIEDLVLDAPEQQLNSVDGSSKGVVQTIMNGLGAKCVYVIDSARTYAEALRQVSTSFTIELYMAPRAATDDEAAKVGFRYPQIAAVAPGMPALTDLRHIRLGTFEDAPPQEIFTAYTYNYDYDPVSKDFRKKGREYRDTTSIAALTRPGFDGEIWGGPIDMYAANRDVDAVTAIIRRQLYQRPANRQVVGQFLISDILNENGFVIEPGVNHTLQTDWATKGVADSMVDEPVAATTMRFDLRTKVVMLRSTVYALSLASMLWIAPDGSPSYADADAWQRATLAYMGVGKTF